MRIDAASAAEVWAVASQMRESDVTEFMAVSWAKTRDELTENLVARFGERGDVICAYAVDEPVAIGALIETRPNVMSLMFFATPEFGRVAWLLTRWIKKGLFPRYKNAGVHRIECASIEGHDVAHRWIGMLGLEHEVTMKGYGRGGETFHQFAWVKP